MVVGAVLVVFTDPVLAQQIANSRDRATMKRQKVRATVLAEKAAHESRKIVHNIRLGAQKQMAIEARKYYKSPEVQGVLRETAVAALQDVMRQAGIAIPFAEEPTTGLPPITPSPPPTGDVVNRPTPAVSDDRKSAVEVVTAVPPSSNGQTRGK